MLAKRVLVHDVGRKRGERAFDVIFLLGVEVFLKRAHEGGFAVAHPGILGPMGPKSWSVTMVAEGSPLATGAARPRRLRRALRQTARTPSTANRPGRRKRAWPRDRSGAAPRP